MNSNYPIEFTARCRAFSSEGVRENRIRVHEDGEVTVWDSVAERYVGGGSSALTDSARARLRSKARRLVAGV